jgi:subtilisin-like proprotein convertase family protein
MAISAGAQSSLVLGLLLVLLCSANAQQFNGRGALIEDFEGTPSPAISWINVEGLGTSASKNYGLVKVCMTIVHQRLSDIKVTLTNPSGRSIWLTNRNGGEEATQYSNTCFSLTGFTGYIHEAKNPFNGEFIPDGKFEVLNEGDLTGDWQLAVEDLRTGATGTLSYWSLFFGEYDKNTKGKCSEKQPQNCICDNGKKQGEMLPDLILLPHFPTDQFQEYGADHPDFPRQIKFAVSIANIGNGPMEVRGSGQWFCGEQAVDSSAVCQDGLQARQYIYQTIYRKKGNRIHKKQVQAGTNYYDNKPGHNHYHVDNWVYYQLLKVEAGVETEVCSGSKVSYCLFDSGICNDADELCLFNGVKYGFTTLHNYGFGGYTDCYAGVQGISVGGYDTYGSMYEGQFLQLPPDVTNGEYILRITVDPKGLYRESDKHNNTLNIPVTLTKQSLQ